MLTDKKPAAPSVYFLLCLIVLSPLAVASTASAQLPWLHVDGKWIKDSQGNAVILHGLNFEGYEVTQYLEDAWSNHTEEDYQKIAGWGFNVVRLLISWQHIEPTEGVYNESYFTYFVDRDIEWAGKYGIYVVLSSTQWYWSPYFTYSVKYPYGLPRWLFEGYPNSEQGEIQSITDFWAGKAPRGATATPTNPSMQDRMINTWKYIAERYKNNPTVAAYDLFNEPPSGSLGIDQASNYLYSFIERLIGEIKTIDANHIFIYQPITGRWDYAPHLLNTPNTIFSVHLYPFYNDNTKSQYYGDITVLENQLLSYLNLPQSNPSENWSIPILIGEFGPATSIFYSGNDLWINDMTDLYNKYGFSWIYFDYGLDSNSKFSIVNPNRVEATEKADALDKPYPILSSIPPVEFSFNRDTGLFEVAFNGVGSVETRIYVPYRYYSNNVSLTNCTSSQWTKNWDEQNRILTVDATVQGTIQITIKGSPLPIDEYGITIRRNTIIIVAVVLVAVLAIVMTALLVRRKRR